MKIFDKIDNAFIVLMKGAYYFMKIAFGLVIGTGIGLIFLLNIEQPLGIVLFFIMMGCGLAGGILYAIRIWKQRKKDGFNNHLY